MLDVGQKAPDFTLGGISANGEERTYHLADLLAEGKSVVLYFYPKDDTPGCTTEACDFRDRWLSRQQDVTVVGISPDTPASHRKFQTKHGLNFPLLSDPDHRVLEAYGAWGEKVLYGKKSLGVIRSTFVVGPDGKVREAWRKVKVAGHADQVLAKV